MDSKFLVIAGILLLLGTDCINKELGPIKKELAKYAIVRKFILFAALYTITKNAWISMGVVLVVSLLYS